MVQASLAPSSLHPGGGSALWHQTNSFLAFQQCGESRVPKDLLPLAVEASLEEQDHLRDNSGLTIENKELKYRLQAMEQQAHLRDALNEVLREEVQMLRIAASQMPSENGNPFSRNLPPQFPSHPQAFHNFGSNQTRQPEQQQQLHVSQSTTSNHNVNGQVP